MIVLVVLFDRIEQAVLVVPVQVPSPPAFVRFSAYPSTICSSVIDVVSVVRVGTICNPSSSTKVFVSSSVVQSNVPVPNPSI
jgi:hypothetical protein